MQTNTKPSARVRRVSDIKGRITTKGEPREVRDEPTSIIEQHVARRISGENDAFRTRVAVTTHEAMDGYREKTMKIANVENNTLNWVSSSSARAPDMTNCDFSVRSARDEMKRIVGSSELDVIIGSDRDQNRGMQEEGRRSHGILV